MAADEQICERTLPAVIRSTDSLGGDLIDPSSL
jgi:hypothetical protein